MGFLEGMDNLSDLWIRRYPPARCYYAQPSLEQVVVAAKRVLNASKATGRKELCIQYVGKDGDITRIENILVGGE